MRFNRAALRTAILIAASIWVGPAMAQTHEVTAGGFVRFFLGASVLGPNNNRSLVLPPQSLHLGDEGNRFFFSWGKRRGVICTRDVESTVVAEKNLDLFTTFASRLREMPTRPHLMTFRKQIDAESNRWSKFAFIFTINAVNSGIPMADMDSVHDSPSIYNSYGLTQEQAALLLTGQVTIQNLGGFKCLTGDQVDAANAEAVRILDEIIAGMQ